MKVGLLSRLLDLVTPRACHVCGCRLSATEEVVCSVCGARLPRTGYWLSAYDNPMAQMFWRLIRIERAAAFYFHQPHSGTSGIIYDMKYNGRPDIGVAMGAMAAREFAPSGFFEGIDVIVPVPLARKRQRQRGYNQSECLAEGIGRATGIPVEKRAIRRTKFVRSQTNLSLWERQDNAEGIFRLRRANCVSGRHVLLVDDVVTSGSTIIACAGELERAGGVRISVMTLAIARS